MPETLPSQLSRTLVSFTTEVDDEFEHRVPHRTTNHGRSEVSGDDQETPWLVSHLMWSTCMRFIPSEGDTIRSYGQSAWWLTRKGISTTLRRMGGWWGYLAIDDAAASVSSKADMVVRPTRGGRRAQLAWESLSEEIEGRWVERFGADTVGALRTALEELVHRFGQPLPDCLLLYEVDLVRRAPKRPEVASSLPGLLSQAILRFELDFEAVHRVPMALCGNVLRVLDGDGVRVKDLSARTGLAKDGVEAGLRSLTQRKLVTVGSDPGGGRMRVVTLTSSGARQQRHAAEVVGAVEGDWRHDYGKRRVAALVDALTPIAGDPDDAEGPLWKGLYRYPEGWRSSLPRPDTLARHPATSHRGGYLDGA